MSAHYTTVLYMTHTIKHSGVSLSLTINIKTKKVYILEKLLEGKVYVVYRKPGRVP